MDKIRVDFREAKKYLHIYRIPGLHDQLFKYKDFVFNLYCEGFENTYLNGNANVILNRDNSLYRNFNSLLENLTEEYYILDKIKGESSNIGIYCQNNNNSISEFHNHIFQNTLITTTYINPIENPNPGGGIEFIDFSDENTIIYPEKDCIYVFPSWLYHRPLPQTRKEVRICLNWGVNTHNRVIHKITKVKW